ncbi:hypothetical protein GOP47_0028888 [Adiantum capillus-veneris]|nr:hypothetical protein GOP47_0028888 [Adiantum capillus-veneris]
MASSQLVIMMVVLAAASSGLAGATEAPAPAPAPVDPHPPVFGADVSEVQGPLNLSIWEAAHAAGCEFAIVKATDGINLTNPYFASQFNDTRHVGILRGAYHVARPHLSDGATQAAFFLDNGGALNSSDELSLTGTLWLESNPACTEGTLCSLEDSCYGHHQHSMGMWIEGFLNAYNATTGSMPFIHTSADWYNSCVGKHGDFSKTTWLWISCIGCPSITTYPYNWTSFVVWQYALGGPLPSNQNMHDE